MSQLKRRKRRRRTVSPRFFVILILFLAAVVLAILVLTRGGGSTPGEPQSTGGLGSALGNLFSNATPTPTPVPTPTPSPTPSPVPTFAPSAVDGTRPSDFGMETGITVDGQEYDTYTRSYNVDMLEGSKYTELEGVITFRGNNFRSGASYGTASITEKKFDPEPWTVSTGSLQKVYGNGSWTGSGWTGQPLIVKWPEKTKQIMNMYDSAKAKSDLIEVIYATLDGRIYFLDLETGEATRDPINVGFPFKGAGALDPRGYPLMYVGSGDHSPKGDDSKSRAFIFSLITGEKLYTFGNSDSFSLRETISYFDSSPLVDAEMDTLLYPGENGIFYSMKLNTKYDETAGTISIDPSEVVRWRYSGERSNVNKQYWLGVEDSTIVWRDHAIFTDNGGHMICLDLNTFEVKWMQDTLDDTNCTPVFELEGDDHHPYVYTSTSFHAGWRAAEGDKALIPIWKIDADTGKIVWENDSYKCRTIADVSGGVQGTIALGEQGLSDLIFVPISRYPSTGSGVLAALDKATGETRWEFEMEKYPWSSPVAVYDESGKGYILQCNQAGDMYLLDGLSGELLDTINLGGNVEASPAVFGNKIVVGTRLNQIYGITLK